MKSFRKMNFGAAILLSTLLTLSLSACGGGKDHNSDDSDVTDAGIISSDAGTDASVESADAGQNIKHYGPDDIVLSYRTVGGFGGTSIYTENGYQWLVVTGDCRYRAFSSISRNSSGHDYLANIVSGQLSESECQASIVDIFYLHQSCTEISGANISDGQTHILSVGDNTLSCYHSCCNASDPSLYPFECRLEKQIDSTLARLLAEGTPIDSKLRGYLTLAPEHAMVSSGAPLQFSEALPEGMEALLQTQEQTPNGPSPSFFKSAIFPDEYQDAVKSLRQKVLNGEMNCSSNGGIPVMDASGTKYLIYARQVTDIEDPDTGKISFPNTCH